MAGSPRPAKAPEKRRAGRFGRTPRACRGYSRGLVRRTPATADRCGQLRRPLHRATAASDAPCVLWRREAGVFHHWWVPVPHRPTAAFRPWLRAVWVRPGPLTAPRAVRTPNPLPQATLRPTPSNSSVSCFCSSCDSELFRDVAVDENKCCSAVSRLQVSANQTFWNQAQLSRRAVQRGASRSFAAGIVRAKAVV